MSISTEPSSSVSFRAIPSLPTESILRSILHSIDDGVLLTDLEHRSLACNRRFGEIFGIDPDEAVAIGVEELRMRVVDRIVDPIGWRLGLDEIYAEPERRFEDEIAIRRAGETILRRIATPVYDDRGRLFGRLWTFSDVTEARHRRRNADLLRKVSSLSDPDPAVNLEAICQAVTDHFGAASQINIVEGDFLRFHFNAGDLGPATGLPGIPKMQTYCGYTIQDDRTLAVQDARLEPKFSVLLPASVGFCRYLGVPVRDEDGKAIGTLCIVDQQMDRLLTPADVEVMEMVAMRANAELARERFLSERIAEKDRQFARKRLELEETRLVLGTMNDAFALLFESGTTETLLSGLAKLLRNVLGYSASAVFLRRPGESRFEVAACPQGETMPRLFTTEADDYFSMRGCEAIDSSLDTTFSAIDGTSLGELLRVPWAAVACLPEGDWGEAVVVLGREKAPPQSSARHAVQLSAIADGVRLVLAARALTDGIIQAHREVSEAGEKALRSEKLAVVGTLAASTAHDIRNIVASLTMLAAEGEDPRMALAAVREQLDRFNLLAHRLLSYAKPGQTHYHPLDVPEIFDRVLSLTEGQRRVSRVVAQLSCDPNLPLVLGDDGQIGHLLINLVLNAVQAMDRTGGHLRLHCRSIEGEIEIRVEDDGPGIPPSVAERLFQPFASSRPQGFGLGLFSAQRIAEAHGGTLAALANPEGGTTMRLTLPTGEGETR